MFLSVHKTSAILLLFSQNTLHIQQTLFYCKSAFCIDFVAHLQGRMAVSTYRVCDIGYWIWIAPLFSCLLEHSALPFSLHICSPDCKELGIISVWVSGLVSETTRAVSMAISICVRIATPIPISALPFLKGFSHGSRGNEIRRAVLKHFFQYILFLLLLCLLPLS